MLTPAMAYAERLGWPVFPCLGKVPAMPRREGGRGYLDATANIQAIREFWARYPQANIGVSCVASGFLALDVDVRHGGDETLSALESRYGPLPVTVRQITGGGGQHILFGEGRDVHFRGSIGPGIDVKYRGHLVVSPSLHPETGKRYAWRSSFHPLETRLADPPSWLADLLRRPRIDLSPAGRRGRRSRRIAAGVRRRGTRAPPSNGPVRRSRRRLSASSTRR